VGFGVWGLGFGVWGSGSMILRFWGMGFRVQDFGVWGLTVLEFRWVYISDVGFTQLVWDDALRGDSIDSRV